MQNPGDMHCRSDDIFVILDRVCGTRAKVSAKYQQQWSTLYDACMPGLPYGEQLRRVQIFCMQNPTNKHCGPPPDVVLDNVCWTRAKVSAKNQQQWSPLYDVCLPGLPYEEQLHRVQVFCIRNPTDMHCGPPPEVVLDTVCGMRAKVSAKSQEEEELRERIEKICNEPVYIAAFELRLACKDFAELRGEPFCEATLSPHDSVDALRRTKCAELRTSYPAISQHVRG